MSRFLIFFQHNLHYVFFLVLISFSINQYYAHIGVLPVDSFSTFNSGYDILNGSIPFKDFWVIKGPVLDIIQALFFKFFGVSWTTYTSHSSTFNTLFAISTYLTLRKFDLEPHYAFTYSLLASILMYPTYGTPFTDHHASIFSILAIYCLCLAIKIEKNIYWFLIPILLVLAFFTKQAPSGHFIILIGFITLSYLFFYFNKKIMIILISSSFLMISLFFFLIIFYEIPLESILIQYFLFPISLSETRLEWLFPLEFQRIVLRYKLLYLALSVPIFLIFRNLLYNFYSINKKDNLIIIALIGTLLIFVIHQLMTINGLFIFFLIPIFSGFSHIYSKNFKNYKKFCFFFLILSLIATIHYHNKYISKRETLILKDVNLNLAISPILLGSEFKNLKWITHHYPLNPTEEIKNLSEAIKIIRNDKRKKMIVTDYQFISVLLSVNDNSASRIWWRHHIYPNNTEKYFDYWKNFLLSKIVREGIQIVYTVNPLEGEKNIFKDLLEDNCFYTVNLTSILVLQELKECKELKDITINTKIK